jgi:hypothetical protein
MHEHCCLYGATEKQLFYERLHTLPTRGNDALQVSMLDRFADVADADLAADTERSGGSVAICW